jgi:hypothetical protein
MRFQQNMAVRQAEHDTTGSQLCGHGGEGGWQRAGGCVAPGDRTHAAPAMEATIIVGWCSLVRPCDFLICGDWRRAKGVDRKGLLDVGSKWIETGFWTSDPPTGASGVDGRLTPSITVRSFHEPTGPHPIIHNFCCYYAPSCSA